MPLLPVSAIQEKLETALQHRKVKRSPGYTLVGPHRDDLILLLNQEWEMRVRFASDSKELQPSYEIRNGGSNQADTWRSSYFAFG